MEPLGTGAIRTLTVARFVPEISPGVGFCDEHDEFRDFLTNPPIPEFEVETY